MFMSCLELMLSTIHTDITDFLFLFIYLFFYCGYPPAKANVCHASGCCCVKGSVVVVSITIQLLLLVYWICLNKTDNKLARMCVG